MHYNDNLPDRHNGRVATWFIKACIGLFVIALAIQYPAYAVATVFGYFALMTVFKWMFGRAVHTIAQLLRIAVVTAVPIIGTAYLIYLLPAGLIIGLAVGTAFIIGLSVWATHTDQTPAPKRTRPATRLPVPPAVGSPARPSVPAIATPELPGPRPPTVADTPAVAIATPPEGAGDGASPQGGVGRVAAASAVDEVAREATVELGMGVRERTRRHIERELLRRCPGDTDSAVAKRVGCSHHTVKAHRLRIGFEYGLGE
jgi:hypothetical protein